MKRAVVIFVVVAGALAALTLTLVVERVPAGHEGLRVGRDGELRVYGEGLRFVPPGRAAFILYPMGERAYRVPSDGVLEVLTQEGEAIAVVFAFDITIAPGACVPLYQRFTENFAPAFDRLVTAAAEMEGAVTSRSGSPEGYRARVADVVREELSPLGVTVRGARLAQWGGVAPSGLPGEVGVAPRPLRRLIVVGVDGGDWLNIEPMIAQGKLPNFRRLVEQGATGPLESMEPMLSPLLWTTMATGKYPEAHGILNFTVVDPESGAKVPITRIYRKVDAFWNMAGDYGRSVSVVGWLATDPPEAINGVMATDKVGYLAYAPGDTAGARASVYPGERAEEIASLVVRITDVTYDMIRRLVAVDRNEFAAYRDRELDPRDPVHNLALLHASTLTYRDIALHLLERDRPDLLAVYFEWVDAVSHLFMLHAPPRMPDVDEAEYERFGRAVAAAYEIQDEILGEIMDRMEDGTVLMVISDHGFKSGTSRLRNRPEIWAGNAAQWHRKSGIVALYGHGIRRGAKIHGASILDVAPTVLALQGLPRAADMPGKVLELAFESELRAALNPNVVATLDREREETAVAGSAAASEATMKKLEALGYLTPDNADAHNNLGQRYKERGEYLKAIEEYRRAIALRPDFPAAYNNMGVCYGKLKRYDEAEAAILKALELNPRDYFAMNNLAVMHIERGQLSKAIEVCRRAVAMEPGYVNGHVTLGGAYAMNRQFDLAEAAFRRALELDPQSAAATENLRRLERARGAQ
ncbi:MAG: alkaline phosphatase family protein [Candidatus Krumholzibacteria bacterium]|nr:alkaline phosphatase family protein [Candidatus Krumholzibacteria bacterium]